MIAADQNSRVDNGWEFVTKEVTVGCAGCAFDLYGQCNRAFNDRVCQPGERADGRPVIWVAGTLTEKLAEPTPCRSQFDACTKPCTPRGVHLQAHAEKLDAFSVVFDDPAYASLGRVLTRAYAQAATGKGAERHGQGQPFERQPMQDLIRLHGVGFATGQASKKAQEALRLPRARAVAELLGAINYLAGAVIAIEAGDTHHKDWPP